jgi:hypothetical protein
LSSPHPAFDGQQRQLGHSTNGAFHNLVLLLRFSDHANRALPRRADISRLYNSDANNPLAEVVAMNRFYVSSALRGKCHSNIVRMGVIVHELGHYPGLPDQLKLSTTSNTVYKIKAGYPEGEYLLIENRQPTEYNMMMEGGGLAIYHIDNKAFEDIALLAMPIVIAIYCLALSTYPNCTKRQRDDVDFERQCSRRHQHCWGERPPPRLHIVRGGYRRSPCLVPCRRADNQCSIADAVFPSTWRRKTRRLRSLRRPLTA